LRLARALMAGGKDKEAFEYVSEGMRLGEGRNHVLDELYFNLLNRFLVEKKGVEVQEEEALNTALNLLSSHFNPETYELIKGVFEKIGRYEELIAAIKIRCGESVVISVLLHDAHIDDAIDILKTMREIAGEEEWKRHIQAFIEANKGKKKLVEKIRGVKLL